MPNCQFTSAEGGHRKIRLRIEAKKFRLRTIAFVLKKFSFVLNGKFREAKFIVRKRELA